jgi:hypothetical protein
MALDAIQFRSGLDLAGPAAQAGEAWTDLWFYSNPIFVYVK